MEDRCAKSEHAYAPKRRYPRIVGSRIAEPADIVFTSKELRYADAVILPCQVLSGSVGEDGAIGAGGDRTR